MSENIEPPDKPTKKPKRWNWVIHVGFWLFILFVILNMVPMCGPFSFSSYSAPVQMRKTQASRAATELATAIRNYHAEYKAYPLSDDLADQRLDTSSQAGLIGILMGENTRGILFFSEKKAKVRGRPGLWFEGEDVANAELFDSWGNLYQVLIDTNGDGKLEVPKRHGNLGETEIIEETVAVWSYGPNGVPGKGAQRRNDDIYTYREYR